MIRRTVAALFLALLPFLALSAQEKGFPDKEYFSFAEWVEIIETTSEYEFENEAGNVTSAPGPDLQLIAHRFRPDGTYQILVPESAEVYTWSWDKVQGVMTILTEEKPVVVCRYTLTEWDADHMVLSDTENRLVLRLERY